MIPKWNKPPKEVTIPELRSFIAAHGLDVAVLMTWSHETDNWNGVTIGCDQLYAQVSSDLRDEIFTKLGMPSRPLTGDLRHEHIPPAPTEKDEPQEPHIQVSLTHADLNFLVWLLGRIFSERDNLDERHQQFIDRYHERLLPILGNAYENIGKVIGKFSANEVAVPRRPGKTGTKRRKGI